MNKKNGAALRLGLGLYKSAMGVQYFFPTCNQQGVGLGLGISRPVATSATAKLHTLKP